MDGEWTSLELEFNTWGFGLAHMAAYKPCSRCKDTGFVGHPMLPLPCPECTAEVPQ